jgi:hypothetical protein
MPILEAPRFQPQNSSSSQPEIYVSIQAHVRKLSPHQLGVSRCSNHGRIVCGKNWRREIHRQPDFFKPFFETVSKATITRNTPGNHNGTGVVDLCGSSRIDE